MDNIYYPRNAHPFQESLATGDLTEVAQFIEEHQKSGVMLDVTLWNHIRSQEYTYAIPPEQDGMIVHGVTPVPVPVDGKIIALVTTQEKCQQRKTKFYELKEIS